MDGCRREQGENLQQANLSSAPRSRAGRPAKAEAEQRRALVLDRALEVFLERGYEGATVELIAAAAGASKRTLYAHYGDKTALFKAAVERAIERYAEPEGLTIIESDDIEATLVALGRMRLAHVISPVGMRLQRILNAEAYRFPEIFEWAVERGSRPMNTLLADVLRRHAALGEIDVEDPDRAATAFLSMVVGGPARMLQAGGRLEEAELENKVRFAVRLFLRGALVRTAR
jgi:TetR/AcrR family transcriptional repressor of mexJK operon